MTINATCKLKNDVKGTQTVDHMCKKINLQTFYTNNINQNDSIENLHICDSQSRKIIHGVYHLFFGYYLLKVSKFIKPNKRKKTEI